jgi:hypothetical protein
MLIGPNDGVTGYKRCDVSISRVSSGGLHVEIEVPLAIGQQVGNLLAALGVKAGR